MDGGGEAAFLCMHNYQVDDQDMRLIVWTLAPRSLLVVARPRAISAQPVWVLAQGLSDHSEVVVDWPQRCALPVNGRLVPTAVAEDAELPSLMGRLHACREGPAGVSPAPRGAGEVPP